MALEIQAVLQPQHAKLILGELPAQETARLVRELDDAFVDKLLVNGVVDVHRGMSPCAAG
ncbi:hypothetical protein [Ralstonia pseudosolanacearum]|uniref:hypothetical protein n=1 Tax=Ralstonia pseudosolanacearum TaxID=1310165 RepID=UPI001E472F36|nr:hypothetical protein [Ralstonia pseudosolanacearum]